MYRKLEIVQSDIINRLPEVQDGLFKVSEDGIVYIRKKDGYALAKQFATSKNKRYKAVAARVDGKQKHFYVHRLVAEAYIPNPNGYRVVSHKDGDLRNNHVSNLEWRKRQNYGNAWKTRIKNYSKPCTICGDMTFCKDGICRRCKPKLATEVSGQMILDRKSDERRERWTPELIEKLDGINRDVVIASLSGKTCNDIAKEFGVTRQRIHQIISRDQYYRSKQVNPLKRMRKAAGFVTQASLADYLGIPEHIISKWERGEKVIEDSMIDVLSDVYGHSISEIKDAVDVVRMDFKKNKNGGES